MICSQSRNFLFRRISKSEKKHSTASLNVRRCAASLSRPKWYSKFDGVNRCQLSNPHCTAVLLRLGRPHDRGLDRDGRVMPAHHGSIVAGSRSSFKRFWPASSDQHAGCIVSVHEKSSGQPRASVHLDRPRLLPTRGARCRTTSLKRRRLEECSEAWRHRAARARAGQAERHNGASAGASSSVRSLKTTFVAPSGGAGLWRATSSLSRGPSGTMAARPTPESWPLTAFS